MSYSASQLALIWAQALTQVCPGPRQLLASQAALYSVNEGIATILMPESWHASFSSTQHCNDLTDALSAAVGQTVHIVLVPAERRPKRTARKRYTQQHKVRARPKQSCFVSC